MDALQFLVNNPDIKHPTIRVAFTPDEEIGRGTQHFDIKKFAADFAYTLDGGAIGELEYENFNAAEAKITINGRNVHPGTAKNQMVNSMYIAMELNAMLPPADRPEHTEGYEGFFHLISFKGDVEQTKLHYIIRDHDRFKFEKRKQLMRDIVEFLNKKYGKERVLIEMYDQYYNMREKIEPVMYVVDYAKKAMELLGIEPLIKPIRGGTDGAMLSFRGLPTPNIFTGGHNFHGRYEYIPLESMKKASQVVVKIAELVANA
jgi:tripeptide aminopeptidase